MKNITVRDGITVIERKILEGYVLLLSYFSLFYRSLFVIRDCIFVLLCTPWFYLLTLWAYSSWAPVIGKLVQRWNWWDIRTYRQPERERQTVTPRDGSETSLQFFLIITEGYKSRARVRTVVMKRRR